MKEEDKKSYWYMNKKIRNTEYNKQNTVRVKVNLNKNTDAELIRIYESIPNKSQWIKECLLEYKSRH